MSSSAGASDLNRPNTRSVIARMTSALYTIVHAVPITTSNPLTTQTEKSIDRSGSMAL